MVRWTGGWIVLVAMATAVGAETSSRPAAFESVTLEAESGDVVGGQVEKIEGASKGQAVLLGKPGALLKLTATLPAGAYSVQVRAKAKDADTFNELYVKASEQAMRPVYPTNAVFTRMKGHFQRSRRGPVSLLFTLQEGSGVSVDQVRVFRQDLDYRFKRLKPLHLTTTLAASGRAMCQIVLPDDGSCRAAADRLAGEIGGRGGQAPVIRPAAEIGPDAFKQWHLVMLGDVYNNIAILRTSPRCWAYVPRPEPRQFNLMTIHDPHGTGKNVIVAGGRDGKTIGKAVDELIRRLPAGPNVTIPRIWLPAWPKPMPRDVLKQLMVDSGKWIRQGAIRTLQNRWKAKGIEGFRLLGYRYIEYKESADTITQRRDDGFSDAEFYKVISAWDRFEEDAYFSDAERLELTDAMWRFFQVCIDPYGRYVAGGQHLKLPQIVERIGASKPAIRHNHQTFPATTFAYAADYFGKYYDLPEAKALAELGKFVFDGQRPCAKPLCDCWGYQDITMLHMVRYAVMQDDWAYVNSPQVRQFLTLRLISHDNQGMPVGYGDSGGYIGEASADWRQANASRWVEAAGGRFDQRRIQPERLLGVYVHPLDRFWHEKHEAKPPLEACFDKIAFRGAYDSKRAYLLLDGLSRGYHGHWDGNAILRLTDNGRVWLGEGDYLNGDLKDHNTVTIVKDGLSDRPPICSTLVGHVDLPGFGATCTRTDDYCEATWDRHILWDKADDVFVLIDRLTARSDGMYDFKCRFRTFGEVRTTGRSFEVTQKDDERFFIRSACESRLRASDDDYDGKKNWSKYPHAEPVTRLLVEQAVRPLRSGQNYAFVNVLYAAGAGESKRYQALAAAPGVVVMNGTQPALVGIERVRRDGLSVDARQFWIGPKALNVAGAGRVQVGAFCMTAEPPVDVAWALDKDRATIKLDQPAKLSFWLAPGASLTTGGRTHQPNAGKPISIDLSAGRHAVDVAGVAKRLSDSLARATESAFQQALQRSAQVVDERPGNLNADEAWRLDLPSRVTVLMAADLNGDGNDETIVGCEDGALRVVGVDGAPGWSHKFAAQVNDVCAADLDGDGVAEVVAGVEDERVHAIKTDGRKLWSHYFEPYRHYKAHVRVVHAADFDGDGTPEVAVGCANSYFYVLDNRGQLRVDADGARWELKTYHSASAIGTADVDGDKHLELLAGCTYFARYIVSFHKRRWLRTNALGGCISGCGSITTADVDGDGHREAIFADKDGRIAAAEKGKPYKAKIIWEALVGDDEITRVTACDLDGDGKGDLLAASRSGFLARLSATDGKIDWIRYGQADMTDAAAADLTGDGRGEAIAGNLDGCVYVYDAAGELIARRQLGRPVAKVAVVRVKDQDRSIVVAAAGSRLVAVRCR